MRETYIFLGRRLVCLSTWMLLLVAAAPLLSTAVAQLSSTPELPGMSTLTVTSEPIDPSVVADISSVVLASQTVGKYQNLLSPATIPMATKLSTNQLAPFLDLQPSYPSLHATLSSEHSLTLVPPFDWETPSTASLLQPITSLVLSSASAPSLHNLHENLEVETAYNNPSSLHESISKHLFSFAKNPSHGPDLLVNSGTLGELHLGPSSSLQVNTDIRHTQPAPKISTEYTATPSFKRSNTSHASHSQALIFSSAAVKSPAPLPELMSLTANSLTNPNLARAPSIGAAHVARQTSGSVQRPDGGALLHSLPYSPILGQHVHGQLTRDNSVLVTPSSLAEQRPFTVKTNPFSVLYPTSLPSSNRDLIQSHSSLPSLSNPNSVYITSSVYDASIIPVSDSLILWQGTCSSGIMPSFHHFPAVQFISRTESSEMGLPIPRMGSISVKDMSIPYTEALIASEIMRVTSDLSVSMITPSMTGTHSERPISVEKETPALPRAHPESPGLVEANLSLVATLPAISALDPSSPSSDGDVNAPLLVTHPPTTPRARVSSLETRLPLETNSIPGHNSALSAEYRASSKPTLSLDTAVSQALHRPPDSHTSLERVVYSEIDSNSRAFPSLLQSRPSFITLYEQEDKPHPSLSQSSRKLSLSCREARRQTPPLSASSDPLPLAISSEIADIHHSANMRFLHGGLGQFKVRKIRAAETEEALQSSSGNMYDGNLTPPPTHIEVGDPASAESTPPSKILLQTVEASLLFQSPNPSQTYKHPVSGGSLLLPSRSHHSTASPERTSVFASGVTQRENMKSAEVSGYYLTATDGVWLSYTSAEKEVQNIASSQFLGMSPVIERSEVTLNDVSITSSFLSSNSPLSNSKLIPTVHPSLSLYSGTHLYPCMSLPSSFISSSLLNIRSSSQAIGTSSPMQSISLPPSSIMNDSFSASPSQMISTPTLPNHQPTSGNAQTSAIHAPLVLSRSDASTHPESFFMTRQITSEPATPSLLDLGLNIPSVLSIHASVDHVSTQAVLTATGIPQRSFMHEYSSFSVNASPTVGSMSDPPESIDPPMHETASLPFLYASLVQMSSVDALRYTGTDTSPTPTGKPSSASLLSPLLTSTHSNSSTIHEKLTSFPPILSTLNNSIASTVPVTSSQLTSYKSSIVSQSIIASSSLDRSLIDMSFSFMYSTVYDVLIASSVMYPSSSYRATSHLISQHAPASALPSTSVDFTPSVSSMHSSSILVGSSPSSLRLSLSLPASSLSQTSASQDAASTAMLVQTLSFFSTILQSSTASAPVPSTSPSYQAISSQYSVSSASVSVQSMSAILELSYTSSVDSSTAVSSTIPIPTSMPMPSSTISVPSPVGPVLTPAVSSTRDQSPTFMSSRLEPTVAMTSDLVTPPVAQTRSETLAQPGSSPAQSLTADSNFVELSSLEIASMAFTTELAASATLVTALSSELADASTDSMNIDVATATVTSYINSTVMLLETNSEPIPTPMNTPSITLPDFEMFSTVSSSLSITQLSVDLSSVLTQNTVSPQDLSTHLITQSIIQSPSLEVSKLNLNNSSLVPSLSFTPSATPLPQTPVPIQTHASNTLSTLTLDATPDTLFPSPLVTRSTQILIQTPTPSTTLHPSVDPSETSPVASMSGPLVPHPSSLDNTVPETPPPSISPSNTTPARTRMTSTATPGDGITSMVSEMSFEVMSSLWDVVMVTESVNPSLTDQGMPSVLESSPLLTSFLTQTQDAVHQSSVLHTMAVLPSESAQFGSSVSPSVAIGTHQSYAETAVLSWSVQSSLRTQSADSIHTSLYSSSETLSHQEMLSPTYAIGSTEVVSQIQSFSQPAESSYTFLSLETQLTIMPSSTNSLPVASATTASSIHTSQTSASSFFNVQSTSSFESIKSTRILTVASSPIMTTMQSLTSELSNAPTAVSSVNLASSVSSSSVHETITETFSVQSSVPPSSVTLLPTPVAVMSSSSGAGSVTPSVPFISSVASTIAMPTESAQHSDILSPSMASLPIRTASISSLISPSPSVSYTQSSVQSVEGTSQATLVPMETMTTLSTTVMSSQTPVALTTPTPTGSPTTTLAGNTSSFSVPIATTMHATDPETATSSVGVVVSESVPTTVEGMVSTSPMTTTVPVVTTSAGSNRTIADMMDSESTTPLPTTVFASTSVVTPTTIAVVDTTTTAVAMVETTPTTVAMVETTSSTVATVATSPTLPVGTSPPMDTSTLGVPTTQATSPAMASASTVEPATTPSSPAMTTPDIATPLPSPSMEPTNGTTTNAPTTIAPTTQATTQTTTPTPFDTSFATRPFWLVLGVGIAEDVDIKAPSFVADMELKLVEMYLEASSRSNQRMVEVEALLEQLNPENNPAVGVVGRRRRAATVGAITVQIIDLTRDAVDPRSVELIFYVVEDGTKLPAGESKAILEELSVQEMTLFLGVAVNTAPTEYDAQPPTTSPAPRRLWIIGAVLGPLAAMFLCCCCCCCLCCGRKPRKEDGPMDPDTFKMLQFKAKYPYRQYPSAPQDQHLQPVPRGFDVVKQDYANSAFGMEAGSLERAQQPEGDETEVMIQRELPARIVEGHVSPVMHSARQHLPTGQSPTPSGTSSSSLVPPLPLKQAKAQARARDLVSSSSSDQGEELYKQRREYMAAQEEVSRVLEPELYASQRNSQRGKAGGKKGGVQKVKERKVEGEKAGKSKLKKMESLPDNHYVRSGAAIQEESEAQPPEPLQETRQKMHALIDEAFSLVGKTSPSRNVIAPSHEYGSRAEGKKTPRDHTQPPPSRQLFAAEQAPTPRRKPKDALKDGGTQTAEMGQTTKVVILPVNRPPQEGSKVIWSPYNAADEMASLAPMQEPASLPGGLNPSPVVSPRSGSANQMPALASLAMISQERKPDGDSLRGTKQGAVERYADMLQEMLANQEQDPHLDEADRKKHQRNVALLEGEPDYEWSFDRSVNGSRNRGSKSRSSTKEGAKQNQSTGSAVVAPDAKRSSIRSKERAVGKAVDKFYDELDVSSNLRYPTGQYSPQVTNAVREELIRLTRRMGDGEESGTV